MADMWYNTDKSGKLEAETHRGFPEQICSIYKCIPVSHIADSMFLPRAYVPHLCKTIYFSIVPESSATS